MGSESSACQGAGNGFSFRIEDRDAFILHLNLFTSAHSIQMCEATTFGPAMPQHCPLAYIWSQIRLPQDVLLPLYALTCFGNDFILLMQ